jgi:RNA polymerase sigma factor (sigma-70 family)
MTLPPFATFLEQHRVDVYRYLTALVGPDRADDCFQETFLAALRAYPRLHPGGNHRAWILTIASRKAIDDGRGRARRPLPLGDLPERSMSSVSDGEPELWRAVRSLPPKQRDALVHRYVLDRSYREVGEALGCSEEAARASAHEGRKRLRKELALIGQGEEDT